MSSPETKLLNFLNENFINTWVANSELGRIQSLREPIAKRREREGKTFDTSHPLAQAIIKGGKTGSKKGSPVDCLVISPEFEVMGRQMVNGLREDSERRGLSRREYYLTFLKEALEGKSSLDWGASFLPVSILRRSVLDLFRTPTIGRLSRIIPLSSIDTTTFEEGGTLTVDIEIGREEGEAAFYLFDGDIELATTAEITKRYAYLGMG